MSLCPWCGAYSPRYCDLDDEAGCCPWQESGEYERELEMEDDGEPDPDRLREDQQERVYLDRTSAPIQED